MDKIKGIILGIEEIQHRWFGHFTRGEDKTLNKEINWVLPGRKKRGKPKPMWNDGMLINIGKRNMTDIVNYNKIKFYLWLADIRGYTCFH